MKIKSLYGRVLSSVLLCCLLCLYTSDCKPEVTKRDFFIGAAGVAVGFTGLIFTKLILSTLFKKNMPVVDHIDNSERQQVMPCTTTYDKGISDFVGQNGVVFQVAEFLDEFANFSKYKRLGAKKVRALFIEGQRGNGKTLLANVIAAELGCCLISIDGYFFSDSIAEVSEAKMKFVFDFAKSKSRGQRTILLIDNIDAFAQMSEFYKLDAAKKRTVNALTDQILSIGENENLIVIGTSNSSADLDSKLFRPGCFDRKVHIPLPDAEGRADMLCYFLQNIICANDVTTYAILKLAEQSAGFSASFLKDLTQEAALIAGRGGSDVVTKMDLDRACKKLKLKKQTIFSQDKEESFFYTFSEKTRFKDVIGQEEALIEIKEFIDFLKYPDRYTQLGARKPRGLLLHGPSGCGKTLIARAIAGEAGCCFISVSGSEFVKKYVGTGAGNVRAIFNFARKISRETPAIIFIDEVDGLGHRQGVESSSARTEYNNTINEMLKQMDGFTKDENILIVGATNLIKELDPALIRPGRFDRKVLIPMPRKEAREAILKNYLLKISLEPTIDIDKLVDNLSERTLFFSGADLENFVNEATILAARKGSYFVGEECFDQALDKIVLGLKTKVNSSKDQLERTAYHEAGHAIVAFVLKFPVEKISILPRGESLGVTWMRGKYEEGSDYTRSDLFDVLVRCYGGFAAEELSFGEVTPGVSDDLNKAGDIAKNMVNLFGMGEGDLAGVPRSAVSSEIGKDFDKQVIKIIHDAYEKSKEILNRYKNVLAVVAGELLQKETLSKESFYKIMMNCGDL